ncbi:MAG: dihydropyrimidinase [Clostridia bacterium]|nr:dihydropyrimidinase [Clostridia bacterium]
MRILIKNGTVVRSTGRKKADVLVKDGRIEKIAPAIEENADRVIDASDCYVFAGFIDTHTHFDLDLGTTVTADDFETGTKAAVVGGTTTVLDFATQDHGMTMHDALDLWHKKADGRSSSNYGFHMAVSEWNDARKAEVDDMFKAGISSFKMYMVYDAMKVSDGQIYDAQKFIGARGGVIGVHCENYDVLQARIAEEKAKGHMDPTAHPVTRPQAVEAEGVARLMRIAELSKAPAWVVHLSTADGLEEVKRARKRGIEVYAESCPQYFTLDVKQYAEPDGAKYVMSPPLREAGDRAAILDGMKKKDIDFIGTDHCSFTMAQKAMGKDDFSKIPNGGAGVQNRAELVYTYAVETGAITLEQMALLLSERAAKLFGMYPKKGVLRVGADADIVVFDPNDPHTISWETNLHACDNSPYEGIKASGRTRDVILNGELVVENGQLVKPNCGRYVFRKPCIRYRS